MIESVIIEYLENHLSVPVYGDAPQDISGSFVTVEQVGGTLENKIESASIAVQSWADTRADAAALNDQVKAVLAGAVELDNISKCHLDTNYNYTDTTTKKARYQAIFEVVFF